MRLLRQLCVTAKEAIEAAYLLLLTTLAGLRPIVIILIQIVRISIHLHLNLAPASVTVYFPKSKLLSIISDLQVRSTSDRCLGSLTYTDIKTGDRG